MKHLSSEMKQKEQHQKQWHKAKVLELSSQGYSEREISQKLQVSDTTVHRDLVYLKTHIQQKLPEEYKRCLHEQKSYAITGNSFTFCRYIPHKEARYDGLVLNWPRFDLDIKCHSILEQESQGGNDPKKYENTLSFYQNVINALQIS